MATYNIPAKRRSVEHTSSLSSGVTNDQLFSSATSAGFGPSLKSTHLGYRFWDEQPPTYPAGIPTTGDMWTPHDSSQLYNVPGWGAPYFFVGDNGNIMVKPRGCPTFHPFLPPLIVTCALPESNSSLRAYSQRVCPKHLRVDPNSPYLAASVAGRA